MKQRFASYLLMGKATTLSAYAAVPPDYTDFTSSQVSLLDVPNASNLALAPGPYGGNPTLCVGAGVPDNISVVVTGVTPGDTVWLVASADKDNTGYLSVNPNLHIGTTSQSLADVFWNNQASLINSASVAGDLTSAVRMSLKLNALAQNGISLTPGSKFYLQAFVQPQSAQNLSGTALFAAIRYSELDTVTVSAGGSSQYGGAYGCTAY